VKKPLGVVLLFWSLVVAQSSSFAPGDRVTVVTDAVKVRDGAGLSFNTLGSQKQGAGATVIASSDGLMDGYFWVQLDYDEGSDGWTAVGDANETFIEKVESAPPYSAVVTVQLPYSQTSNLASCYTPCVDCDAEPPSNYFERQAFWESVSVSELQSLLVSGLNVNTYDEFCSTLLMNAVRYSNEDVIQFLIDTGADVNAPSSLFPLQENVTPLMEARTPNVTKLLLGAGANVHAMDSNNNTPLIFAAADGNLEIIKLLVEAGANVNTTGSKYVDEWFEDRRSTHAGGPFYLGTVLNAAIESGSLEAVDYLIQSGASLQGLNTNNYTPLEWAVGYGTPEIFSFLLENGASYGKGDGDASLVYLASINPTVVEMIQMLAETGVNINACNEHGSNALTQAAFYRETEVIKMLLEAGVDVNACEGRALIMAVSFGSAERLQIFVDAGADVNARGGQGRTPLMLAAASGERELVEVLLKAGADVTAVGPEGKSALWMAAEEGYTDVVSLLLENGGLINSANENGLTALMVAAANGHHAVIQMLLEAGADPLLESKDGLRAIDYAEELRGTDVYTQLSLASGVTANTYTVSPLTGEIVVNICSSEIRGTLSRSGRASTPSATELVKEHGLGYREEDSLWAYVVDVVYWNEDSGGRTTFLCLVDPQRNVELQEYPQ
jgi:uncharacterized protein